MDSTAAKSAEEGSPDLSSGPGATATSAISSASANPPEQKKRNRIRFSCTSCREKKLKCNRQSPCDQCQKRHLADSCTFIPYVNPRPGTGGTGRDALLGSPSSASPGPRGKVPITESALHARLKHLEHLVQVLKAQKRETTDANAVTSATIDGDEPLPTHCEKKLAGVLTDTQRYFEAANWESILDDIVNLTNDLKTHETSDDTDDTDQLPSGPKKAVLLSGGFPYAAVPELASLLPSRNIRDRLISHLFQVPEPSWIVFHIPSFLRDYDAFGRGQYEASYAWLGLVFAMSAYATLKCSRLKGFIADSLGEPLQVFETLKRYAAQCIALSDYSTPGKWKIEALMIYFGCEYFQKDDSPLGCSLLMSIMLRLAMHMGLHRDPKHYPDMTPFEGEMRRRIWVILLGADRLLSFQFGLPSNVHIGISDTEAPSNLHDDDFDVDSAELPPSRPETERTRCLSAIVRSRLIRVFGGITAALNSRDGLTYAAFAKLDKELEEARKTVPSLFRTRPVSQSLADPVDLIMQRYWLDFLYQKSRLILHRQFLARGRTDKRFEYSRRTCLDAATQILRYQYDIHCELQPGGRFAQDRSLIITSLSIHDFLLADMILCLELSFVNARKNDPQARPEAVKHFANDTSQDILSKEKLMDILQTSRSVWQSMRKESAEANKGFKILTRMLNEATGNSFESSPESTGAAHQEAHMEETQESAPMYPPPFQFGAEAGSNLSSGAFNTTVPPLSLAPNWGSSIEFDNSTGMGPMGQTPQAWLTDPNIHTQDIMDGMVDPALTGNWSMWDLQVHKGPSDICSIPWNSFFQAQANDPE